MRVLITGGTGFLGGHIARRLQAGGHEVTVLGRSAAAGKKLEAAGIRFVQADLADNGAVMKAIEGQEQVIHCGALAAPWGKYRDFYDANVVGTQNVVAACRQHGVDRLVNISTPSLYFDYRHREQIKESDPLPQKPATHYAATKLLADEEVDRASAAGLKAVSLRPRGIFGPGDRTVLGRVITAARGGAVPLVGGGRSLVDLTYVDNVVDAVELAMRSGPQTFGKKYNITNGEPTQMRVMVQKLFTALGEPIPKLRPMPFFIAWTAAALSELWYAVAHPGVEPRLVRYSVGLMAKTQTLDISAARRELGYEPKVSLDEGVRRFAAWWKAEGAKGA